MDYNLEKQQAIEAGEKALLALREARRQLDEAKGLGLFDLLGAGALISIIKQAKIQKAKKAINEAKFRLETFSSELKDISINLNIDIGSFLTIFDIWDSFLVDVLVQSRMRDAVHKIDDTILRVEAILSKINS